MVDHKIEGHISLAAKVEDPSNPQAAEPTAAPAAEGTPADAAPAVDAPVVDPAALAAATEAPIEVPVRFKLEHYLEVHKDGVWKVAEKIAVKGVFPRNHARFFGSYDLHVETDQGKVTVPLEFPIAGAETVDQAFDFFPGILQGLAERAIPQVKARYARKKVVAPAAPPRAKF